MKCCLATVEKISWERIFLILEINVKYSENQYPDIPLVFYAVASDHVKRARFKQEKIDESHYRLTLNITNQGERMCVAQGDYRLIVCQGKCVLAECETDIRLVAQLENLSKNFLYNNRSKVFSVSFYVAEGESTLPFRMYILPAKKIEIAPPENRLFQSSSMNIKKVLNKYRRPFLCAAYRFYRKRYGENRKTILFMSEQSSSLGSNQTAVVNRMKKRGLDKEYTILVNTRPASSQPQSKKSWFQLIQKLAKSSMVILDDHAPVLDWLKLDKSTTVVQLWHSGVGFKSSGYSRWGHEGCPGPWSAHRQYKYGIAGSKTMAHIFSEMWGINEEDVLLTGLPRIDEYLDQENREKKIKELYEKYPMCRGKKVILFAPTYRGKNKKNAFYPYELIDFEQLYQVCGDEYVVLFKMHPWVSENVPIDSSYEDKFVDANKYPNINDLFYITDLLITDYSSNIFEYSLMRRPMLFFAFDKIQYSFSRGFFRPYEESAPGKICYCFSEVIKAIEEKDFEFEKVEQYVEHHFDLIDSNSSDRVIDWIIRGQIPEDIQKGLMAVDEANKAMHNLVIYH